MKFLIVGLGNIGSEYSETRHNIGFKIVDAFAKASTTFFQADRLGDVCEVRSRGRTYILLKPTTYMNLSGKAVSYWLQQTKIPVHNLLVITDDIALSTGVIRIRAKGSDGGHNGLKSINEILGTTDYARMRFGVGNDFPKGRQVEYVLGKWTESDMAAITPGIDKAVEAIKAFGLEPLGHVMTRFNG